MLGAFVESGLGVLAAPRAYDGERVAVGELLRAVASAEGDDRVGCCFRGAVVFVRLCPCPAEWRDGSRLGWPFFAWAFFCCAIWKALAAFAVVKAFLFRLWCSSR